MRNFINTLFLTLIISIAPFTAMAYDGEEESEGDYEAILSLKDPPN